LEFERKEIHFRKLLWTTGGTLLLWFTLSKSKFRELLQALLPGSEIGLYRRWHVQRHSKAFASAVQANMGSKPLAQEQSDRLQSAIKAEVTANTMDDTDLFRPVDEWTQMVSGTSCRPPPSSSRRHNRRCSNFLREKTSNCCSSNGNRDARRLG
jgi:hypothetical protein